MVESQLFGGPAWISTERYDIQARVESGPSSLPHMMQAILEDRFEFKAHREMRELPVFVLTVASGGSKLKAPDGQPELGLGALVQGSAGTNGTPAGVEMAGKGITIARLMNMVASRAGRPIIDNTKLNGLFDFTLSFAPSVTADSARRPLCTALQEQFGLTLDSARESVEVLIIDNVLRPSEN